MEETVFLFFSKKQFTNWKTENCGNCRNESAGFSGCRLSAALADALHPEGVVPLNLAERIGYFDITDEDHLVRTGTWTCREFREKDVPWARPLGAPRPVAVE